MFASAAVAQAALEAEGYFATLDTAARVVSSANAGRPLFVEGPAGVGKSSLAIAIASSAGARLVRLDCDPRLTPAKAVYHWDAARQVAAIQAATAAGKSPDAIEREISGPGYLVEGPLMAALTGDGAEPVVLLVDGIERSNVGLVALLATFIRDYELTIPGIGVYRATHRPLVVITCNGDPGGLDGLRAACLRLQLDYPAFDTELRALLFHVPAIGTSLATTICNVVRQLRAMGLAKPPGIDDTIQWAQRMALLRWEGLDVDTLSKTIDLLLKAPDDRALLHAKGLDSLLRPRLDLAG